MKDHLRLFLTATLALCLASSGGADAQWFGTKTGRVSRLYVLVRVDDELGLGTPDARRDERRWAADLLTDALAKARLQYPRAVVGGGIQVSRTDGPVLAPDPIIGTPLPSGTYHLLRITVETCSVSSWLGSYDNGFCWKTALHYYDPTNKVLGKKEGESPGTDIDAVASAVTKFMSSFRD